MNNSVAMRSTHGIANVIENVEVLLDRIFVKLSVPVFSTLEHLHRIEQSVVAGDSKVMNGNYVRMVEACGDLRFIEELVNVFLFWRIRL